MAILKLILTICLSFTFLTAGELAIEPYTQIYHYDRDRDSNENTKYLGLVYRYDNFDIGVATYENSHYTRSQAAYVGYRYPLYEKNDLTLGIFGLVGYRTNYEQSIIAYGGPYVEYQRVYFKVNINGKFVGATLGLILFRF